MNKKLLLMSILAVLLLVTISLASAVNTTPVKPVKRKDSPLFGIRTRRAIGDRLRELRENIKARFIGERVFFLPFQWLKQRGSNLLSHDDTVFKEDTCSPTFYCSPGICVSYILSSSCICDRT